MNYLNKPYVIKGSVKLIHKNGELIVTNLSNTKKGYIFYYMPVLNNKRISIEYNYTSENGICQIKLLNKKFKTIRRINNPGNHFLFDVNKLVYLCLVIPTDTTVTISKLTLNKTNIEFDVSKNLVNDNIIIVPGYPSLDNKYNYAFVHTRVKEYQKNGLHFDVVVANDNTRDYECLQTFEGIQVNYISYNTLRTILQKKMYKNIVVHFFTTQVAQILDSVNITESKICIFTHGSDILYRDKNILACKYGCKIQEYSDDDLKYFSIKDKIINRYNELTNVYFIFPSLWVKKHAEEQNNISFNNYKIIPTFIDSELFSYEEKDPSLRYKILIIRKFDDYNTYSIDLDVKTILELKKHRQFESLDISIYGDGEKHDELLKPISNLKNVHIFKKFLTHEEIADVHKKHGIALFATRYETQGVSAAEAACSGLVVLTNKVAAVDEMFHSVPFLMAKPENYHELAEKILDLVSDEKKFFQYSRKCHNIAKEKYSLEKTINIEIDMFNKKNVLFHYTIPKIHKEKILTVGIAAYNVESYLFNCVLSLIKSKYAGFLEVLIVNDGSKDLTALIGKKLEDITTKEHLSIVKIINKENGGHGSALNTVIKNASGKYIKFLDGDDYFDTAELDTLIEKLKITNADIVLTNYVEDLSVPCILNPIHYYEFMEPDKVYNIEKLIDDNKGFQKWGPLLSTSTFKTSMLKNTNYSISEHCFYVDMELNSIAFMHASSIVYFPLDVYVYYIGRVGQSISAESFRKNYKNHEHVTLRIIQEIYNNNVNNLKQKYLKNKIILPLIEAQYYITTEYFPTGKEFNEFDRQLKKYPELYNDKSIINKRVKIYRMTRGKFIRIFKILIKVKNILSIKWR